MAVPDDADEGALRAHGEGRVQPPGPDLPPHGPRGTPWRPGDSPGSQHVTPRGSIRVGSGTALPPLRGSLAPSGAWRAFRWPLRTPSPAGTLPGHRPSV